MATYTYQAAPVPPPQPWLAHAPAPTQTSVLQPWLAHASAPIPTSVSQPSSAKINFSYSILFHLTTSYSSYFGGKKGISRNKTSFFLLMLARTHLSTTASRCKFCSLILPHTPNGLQLLHAQRSPHSRLHHSRRIHRIWPSHCRCQLNPPPKLPACSL